MPHAANPKHYRELEHVITLAEACRLVGKRYNTVVYAIDAGNVAAIKCGRIWLVHTQSLVDWFTRNSNP